MSYGNPSIAGAIDKLLAKGARRILTLPLYPQYSATTTASVFDAVSRKFATLRAIPEARFINDYHDAPGYIDALASSVREVWAREGHRDKLLLSFHGIPKKMVSNGDPYKRQCEKTAQLLANTLSLGDDEWLLTYQSRVGREEWISPYTDETLRTLGAQGLASVDVVCPGFSADCLETLEEIAMQNAEFFCGSGGGTLRYIPALNARDDHVQFLADLVAEHTAGWVNSDDDKQAISAPLTMGVNL
jgi:ferrochelatase